MNSPQERLVVPGPLRPWVDGIGLAAYGRGGALTHVPDAATVLVWRTAGDGTSAVSVMGPRTQASYHAAKDIPVCVRIRIAPGAAPALLGVRAGEVVDQVVPLGELWGPRGERLGEELAELGPDPARAVARIAGLLRDRAAGLPAHGDAVRAAAALLSVRPGRPAVRVGEAARRVGLSERQLRDVFTAAVGVGPKQYARLSRVRTVLAGARGRSWARLAGEAGYYDQSHMIAEFRRVMRVTPTAFTAGRLPAVAC
ncbi:AraC family transcriptional regulator [Streptomyces sp. NPDC048483]|uniref:helix-turn-helix domain-containing protein n=1 Tax=Streptomyces sp. NPDC048483 TaxID=3154927 RepID=UPI00343C41AE